MNKIVIKTIQDSVVTTRTILGGVTIHSIIAKFLWYIRAKNCENWLAVDGVIAIKRVSFLVAHIPE